MIDWMINYKMKTFGTVWILILRSKKFIKIFIIISIL